MIVIPESFIVFIFILFLGQLLYSRFSTPLSFNSNWALIIPAAGSIVGMHLAGGFGVSRYPAFVLVAPLLLQGASALVFEYFRLTSDDRLSVAAGGTLGTLMLMQQGIAMQADMSFSKLAVLLPLCLLVPAHACLGGLYAKVRRRLGWMAALIACCGLNVAFAQYMWATIRAARSLEDQQSFVFHVVMLCLTLVLFSETARRFAQSGDDGSLAGERPA